MNRSKKIILISILLILTATLVFTGACLDFSAPLGKINLAFDSELVLESSAYAYTGEEVEPAVTLKHRDEIVDSDNYTLTYADNINPGKASVTAKGKGNYYGEVSASFNIGYRYTFDTVGANKVQGEIEQIVLSKQDIIPPTVEKAGYDFSHWSIDSQPVDFNDTDSLPFSGEFVANYILKTYSIVYHLNGGDNHSENKTEYTVEDIFVLQDASLRSMQFAGWYTDSEFNNRITDLNDCAKDLELYAKFVDYTAKKISYVVPDDAVKVPYDILYPETPLTQPKVPDKEIDGEIKKLVWYADSEYKVRYYFREMPNEDITLYAQWEDTLRAGFLDKMERFSSNDFSIDSFEDLIAYVDYICYFNMVSSIESDMPTDVDYISITYVTSREDIKREINKALTAATYPRMASVSYAYKDGGFKIALANDISGKEATLSATDEKDFADQLDNIFALQSKGRGFDYDKFPIDFVEKTFEVESSNQLFYVASHGYRPLPKAGSAAESIYNRYREIMRQICDDSMSDLEKIRAIYEWIILNVQYDNAVAYPDTSTEIGQIAADKNKTYLFDAFYLEGVLRGSAVCDGISKAYSLMCAIEGIDCVRVTGDDGYGAGHAWNKVRLSGEWYLSDATWGNAATADELEYISYKYFLFTDDDRTNSGGYVNQNYLYYVADTKFDEKAYNSLRKVEVGNYVADFYIDSDVELSYLLDYIDVNFGDKQLDGYSFDIMINPNVVINGTAVDKVDKQTVNMLCSSAMKILNDRRGILDRPVIKIGNFLPYDEERNNFARAIYMFR